MQLQVKQTIIIGDNSEEFGLPCREMLRESNREIILTKRDGKDVWEKMTESNPDLIIIDALMPHYDAVNLLHRMAKEQKNIGVIVLTPQGSQYLEEEIIKSGAYCLVKPIDMTYLKECIGGMLKIKPVLTPAGFKKAGQNAAGTLEMQVTEVIFQIGVPAHIKGYAYLRKAIMLTVETPEKINSVTKILYPEVAKAYGTTPSRVERAIRHAIEIAWDRGDVEVLSGYFGYTINTGRGKPTNSEFIAMIADRLRLKSREGNEISRRAALY